MTGNIIFLFTFVVTAQHGSDTCSYEFAIRMSYDCSARREPYDKELIPGLYENRRKLVANVYELMLYLYRTYRTRLNRL